MLNRTVHIPALGQDLLNGSRIGICIHIALKLGFWLATVKTCGIFLAFFVADLIGILCGQRPVV